MWSTNLKWSRIIVNLKVLGLSLNCNYKKALMNILRYWTVKQFLNSSFNAVQLRSFCAKLIKGAIQPMNKNIFCSPIELR